MSRSLAIDMTSNKGMVKNLIKFVAPLMLSGILQLLFTASDLIVCRYFGSEHSVGAIQSTNALINLIVNLFMGLSIGANILMSRRYGAGDKDGAQRVAYTAIILSVVLGVTIGIFGSICSRYFLQWMGTNPELIDLSTQYLAIYFIGVPFNMIYNYCAALLRAVGDTQRPFYFLTGSGVFNVLLNLLLVIACKMDVAGVATATAASQAVAATAVFLYIYFKKGNFFTFKFKQMRFYKKEALEIIRLGLPAGIQGSLFSISNVMIQTSVNQLSIEHGAALVDGNGASSSLEGFVYTAMNSCAQGVVTFGSANYGAKNKQNIKRVIFRVIMLVMICWFVPSVFILAFHRGLLGIYVSTEEAINFGADRIFYTVGLYFLCGLMEIFAYSLRAIGYSVLPTVISTLGACGFRLLWIFVIFPINFFHNLTWLAISYPISWTLTALTHAIFFAVLFKRLKFDPNTSANSDENDNPNQSEVTATKQSSEPDSAVVQT
ncbi:MAG: MATE family efflux transporter [Clostridiales bacterium]|nr:MATE family efflux transporter [Clostridiales bacterium]